MNRSISRTATLQMSAGAAIAAALSRPAGAQTSATVNFASVGGITDAPIYLAQELGYFSAAGITINKLIIPSAPGLVTALAASQLDVAGISVTPGLFAAVERGITLRIVGDKQSYRTGYSVTRLLVRPALAKAKLADTVQGLRGKTVAVSAKAGATYFLLAKCLEKFGMTLGDVKVVELSYPNMDPAFTTGAIDAAIHLEPYLSQTVRAGDAKVVSDLVEFAPGGNMLIVPVVYSETFAKNRPLANAFMKAYMQGSRYYIDAILKDRNKDNVMDIIARGAKLDPALVKASYPFWIDPEQHINVPALDVLQSFFIEQQMLTTRIDLARVVDPSFAQAAVAALGPYRYR